MIEITTKEALAAVLDSGPTVVFFCTPTCQPCKQTAIQLEELEDEVDATFVKIDCTKSDLHEDYKIQAVPVVMVIDKSQIVYQKKGLDKNNELKQYLNNEKSTQ